MRWCALLEPPSLNGPVVLALTAALTAINLDYLRRHPSTPKLYRSGIIYQREPTGGVGGGPLKVERWASIPFVLSRGAGDCEDLACFRAAELQHQGEAAAVSCRKMPTPSGGSLFHVFVRRQSGRIEDPSALLGM